MNKGGVGVGSASIILIFAVLCLSVFSLITYVVAGNDKTLVQSESKFVIGYYEADTLAERVLNELLQAEIGLTPDSILEVDIETDYDISLGANVFYYSCPISGEKELFVRVARTYDSYNVLSWQMRDTGEWEMDTNLNVFMGFDDMDAPMWDMSAPMWDMLDDDDTSGFGGFPWENTDSDDDSGGSGGFPWEDIETDDDSD